MTGWLFALALYLIGAVYAVVVVELLDPDNVRPQWERISIIAAWPLFGLPAIFVAIRTASELIMERRGDIDADKAP